MDIRAVEKVEVPMRNSTSKEAVKKVVRKNRNHIPDDILYNEALNESIDLLPRNYKFEIHKTLWRIRTEAVETVALQFPEGLLVYACIIADILSKFGRVEVLILGDVTYGACCIDDFTAGKLGAGLLVHYGHSCLVPVNVTKVKVIYIFVEISFDYSHLVSVVTENFKSDTRIALMGTIQFSSVVHNASVELASHFRNLIIPQAKPLSAGETLGCTSPTFPDCETLVFVADGRFHLEAAMIHNPNVKAYRYDPYNKVLSSEGYDVDFMKGMRLSCIEKARSARTFGLILGTLGRQGNIQLFDRLTALMEKHGRIVIPFLMAELNPAKLALIPHIDVWVQVACPRLSIDWCGGFQKPLLTPYELEVLLNETPWKKDYPMDYYSLEGGSYTPYGVSRSAK